MRVAELKALAREHGLRGYSRMRKAEIIELIRNNQQGWAPDIPPRTAERGTSASMGPPRSGGPKVPPAPPRPTRPIQTQSVRFRPDRLRQPRQPTQQEMDIFEQQEMSKSRPQVKSKLNDWYEWLVNHVPKTVNDKASRAFKTFKDKIMGLYNRVTGSGNHTQLKGPGAARPNQYSLSKLSMGLTEAIGLMEGLE